MNSILDVRDFRLFVALGEELHFQRAAQRLRIAQPNLSLHIRQLEQRLRVTLLDRTTRSVKLTPAGKHLLERARYILAQIGEATTATRHIAEGQAGMLNIGFTSSAGFEIVPWILGEFRKSHPNVSIVLSDASTTSQVRALMHGELHFGFLRPPVRTRRLSTLTLSRESVVVVLPRTHRLATRGAVALEDLAQEDFIRCGSDLGVDFQEHVFSHCHRAGFTPRVASEAPDSYAIIALVAAGYGIAILPQWVSHARNSKVVYKSLKEIPPLVELALAWLPEDPSPANQSFRDIVDAYRQAHPLAAI
jgi:DNA-binding transcriptional LysR family regulator